MFILFEQFLKIAANYIIHSLNVLICWKIIS